MGRQMAAWKAPIQFLSQISSQSSTVLGPVCRNLSVFQSGHLELAAITFERGESCTNVCSPQGPHTLQLLPMPGVQRKRPRRSGASLVPCYGGEPYGMIV